VDNVSTQRGAHSLKAGAGLPAQSRRITFPGATQGVYTFSSLSNFLAGNYATYQQAFGAPSQFQSNPNVGLFAQDEWKPRRDLTLNVGLRYDAQFLPDPVETDANNFAPRIGVAYSPEFLGRPQDGRTRGLRRLLRPHPAARQRRTPCSATARSIAWRFSPSDRRARPRSPTC
jgi:hypothetical protein